MEPPAAKAGGVAGVRYGLALSVLATVFFMWGFATVLNDILVPHLKAVFDLNYARSLLIQFVFYLAYLLMSLPSARLLERIGYKSSIIVGLFGMAFAALLFLLGFATKAGLLPMGDWLPDAHPVAPSGISAMLSGVLVKIGVYGMFRVFCDFAPVTAPLRLWGVVIALAGTASLLVGNLVALRQTDGKRLMAFSTIGQVGYVCLALGAGLYCLPQQPALATLAFMGALFHALNHACFKACLFFGAGAVLFRTGERTMGRLGGLGASMPFTAGASTIAALSIGGVPPSNGFASKWLIIATSVLAGFHAPLFLVLGIAGPFASLARTTGAIFNAFSSLVYRLSSLMSLLVP